MKRTETILRFQLVFLFVRSHWCLKTKASEHVVSIVHSTVQSSTSNCFPWEQEGKKKKRMKKYNSKWREGKEFIKISLNSVNLYTCKILRFQIKIRVEPAFSNCYLEMNLYRKKSSSRDKFLPLRFPFASFWLFHLICFFFSVFPSGNLVYQIIWFNISLRSELFLIEVFLKHFWAFQKDIAIFYCFCRFVFEI